MGFFSGFCIRAFEAIIVFFIVVLTPGIPPRMNFTSFSTSPPLPFQGSLALNDLLNNAEHLYEDLLKGPETIVFHEGELYTGIHGGEVIKINNGKLQHIAKFGKKCDGIWEEQLCGRPLGMKFDTNGNLFVVDAYYGLFKVNPATGSMMKLVDISLPIGGVSPKIPNSVDVASDGMVYWTDSSTEVSIQDGVLSLLGDASGRLLMYDPRKNVSTVLMDKVHFANGVLLSPKEDFVLVAETAQSRILRYYLKGPKNGTSDVFLDGLPGLPDNLKPSSAGALFVPLVASRDAVHPIVFQVLGPYPLLRKFLARLLGIIEIPFLMLNDFYPNYYAKRIAHWIGHFESVSMLTPKRVSILEVDFNGNIMNSFHCLDESLSGISEVAVYDGAFYFGSPYNTYIGRVKTSSLVSLVQ